MSDYDLPDLPSDEDLGITDEDREVYEKELADDGPELTPEEMKALLGEDPSARRGRPASDAPPDAKAARRAEKERRKAEKRRAKAEKQRAKAEKQRAQEAKRRAGEAGDAKGAEGRPSEARAPESDSERAERVARALAGSGGGAGDGGDGADGSGGGGDGSGDGPKRGTSDEGPRNRWQGPATLAALLVLALVASARTGLPRPAAANAPDTAFSSARAMSMLIEIATEAHPTGSPEHARVRSYLLDRLRSLGLEPEIQTTTSMRRMGDVARAATVRNILARVPGTDPTGAVLMTAHYDGHDISVAASDDGVGVVTVVEAMRALLADDAPRNDVIVLLTDGEELGLLGARAFVAEHPWMEEVSLVLSFEMRGSAGPSIMFETNAGNGRVIRALAGLGPHPYTNSMSQAVYDRIEPDTDFTPFKEAGTQGLNFAAIGNAHVYHQEYDTPQALDESTLQHHGLMALATVRHFADTDLALVDGPDLVYFTVPMVGVVAYDRWWSMALSGALLLLLVAASLLARRAGASPARVGIAFATSLLAASLAFAAAHALVGWLPRFHPEAGSLAGALFHREGWYVLSFAALTFTSVTGVYALARRWLDPVELGLGWIVLPTLAAIAAGFVAPLAAMNLQWPALAALLAMSTATLLGARRSGVVGWLAALFLTVPVLVLLVPLTEQVWLAFTLEMGAWLTVPIAVTLFLCLSALESLRHPSSWWAPLTGLVVAGAALGIGILMARPTADRPAPSTLVYAYEHGTGAAVWATDPGADSTDAGARAWAVQRAGSSFEGRRDLAGFAYLPGPMPTAPASVVSAQPPEVVLTRDTIDGGTRHVTLRVRSRIGAEYLAFAYDDRGDTRLVSLNGRAIDAPGQLVRAEHWGVPDPAVVLELEMPATEPIGLNVVEHLLRPEEVLGDGAFVRPPDMAADDSRMSDRAMFRYSVAAFADPRHAVLLPGATPGPGAPPASGSAADSIVASPVAPGDTIARDTTAVDTIPRDTLPRDTLPTDTLPPGALPADTPPRDALPTDTLPDNALGGPAAAGTSGGRP